MLLDFDTGPARVPGAWIWRKMESIEVGCAVIIRDGKLLIAQRKLDDSHGGFWEFPGGKREPDENMEMCLIREVREELGIEIRPRALFSRCNSEHAGKKLALFFHFCDWIKGEPECLDCRDVRWASVGELRGLSFPKGDDAVLEELIRTKKIV